MSFEDLLKGATAVRISPRTKRQFVEDWMIARSTNHHPDYIDGAIESALKVWERIEEKVK